MLLKLSESQAGTLCYLYMAVCRQRLHTHEDVVCRPADIITLSDNIHHAAVDIVHISQLQAVGCDCQPVEEA